MLQSESSKMKLPSNYFMQWLRENISDQKIDFDFRFNDEERYLDNVLSKEIDSWKPEVPVIVSAQTGAGKNHFIQKTLLPKLIEENPTENNLILILSNRIALNRQNKYKLAELLVEYKHNAKYLSEIQYFYQPEGIDHIYINFDVVTVCSYHQLYKRCIRPTMSMNDPNFVPSIDISKFKYIICDECHFFTSDASFNRETDKILKEIISQGQNAVRIYMSATPEVALEAILREEFLVSQIKFERDIQRIDKKVESNENTISFYKTMFPKKSRNKELEKNISADKARLSELKKEKFCLAEKCILSLIFYCMARNYDYVVPHFYRQNDELLDLIKNSENKWIIFTNSDGSRIDKMLSENGVSSIFLSRKGIENVGAKKASYDYIINRETTNKTVLVATSVLDNGINITNDTITKPKDKVLNIAIDSFDRIEFIQMLGRIRAEKNMPVQLYIKKYSLSQLKSLLKRDVKALVQILYLKRYEPTSRDFNPCAVYHLVNRMSTMLAIIRNEEPDFCVKFSSPEYEAQKGSIYEFYKTGAGQIEPWSRSIVDLLESSVENIKRKKYIEEDIDNGESDVTRHKSKLADTFVRYLYRGLIPSHYESVIREKYFFYINQLSDREYNRYEYLISLAEKNSGTLSVVGKVKLLKDNFNLASRGILVDVDLIRHLSEKADYYRNLADSFCAGSSTEEQLSWIEKFSCDLVETSVEPLPMLETLRPEKFDNVVLDHCCAESDIEKHRKGNYFDEGFLSQKGIKKGSDLEKSVSAKYFQVETLTKALGKKLEIKGICYELKSFNGNTRDRNTYYVFVKPDSGGSV